ASSARGPETPICREHDDDVAGDGLALRVDQRARKFRRLIREGQRETRDVLTWFDLNRRVEHVTGRSKRDRRFQTPAGRRRRSYRGADPIRTWRRTDDVEGTV